MTASPVTMPLALARLHEALELLHRAAIDERETVAELASHANRRDDDLAELRDELLVVAGRVATLTTHVEALSRTIDARTADAA